MNYRKEKQVIIGLVTLIVVFIFFFSIAVLFQGGQPSAPLLLSGGGAENGNEVKFEPLEIMLEEFFEVRPSTYDAVALIRNSNLEYGASEIAYEFKFQDKDGKELYVDDGKTFILPDQDRYIVAPAVVVNAPSVVFFRIVNVEWKKLAPFSPLGLALRDIGLSRDEENGRTHFFGILENGSPYNLQSAEVQVALYDPAGDIVAAGQTNMQTILRGEKRAFQIIWPNILPANLDIDARVGSNFLKNSNFIRDYASSP